jgi:hypothetical protein
MAIINIEVDARAENFTRLHECLVAMIHDLGYANAHDIVNEAVIDLEPIHTTGQRAIMWSAKLRWSSVMRTRQ